MTKDEALRVALDALKTSMYPQQKQLQAITVIEAALEAKDEPWEKFCDSNCVWTDHHSDCKLAEQKPVAWMYDWTTSEGEFIQNWTTSEAESLRDTEPTIITNVRPLYAHPPKQQVKDEPVVWWDGSKRVASPSAKYHDTQTGSTLALGCDIPLYGAPQQRKPLTDEEIVQTFCKAPHQTQHVAWFAAGVRYAEASHGIKGEA